MQWLEKFVDGFLVQGILQMQYGREYVVIMIALCLGSAWLAQGRLYWNLREGLGLLRHYRRQWHQGKTANPGTLWEGVFEQYKTSVAKGNEQVNTPVMLEDAYDSVRTWSGLDLERVNRICMSILLMLGLIGTFLGLTQSLFEIKGVLQQMGVDSMAKGDLLGQIIQRLLIPLQRMSTAFVTSLLGIGSSMLLSVTALLLRLEQKREEFFTEAEDFLDNELFPTLVRPNSIQGAGDLLAEKFQGLFAQLSSELAANFQQAMQTMAGEMKEVSKLTQDSLREVAMLTKGLAQSGEVFLNGAKQMDRVALGLGQQATTITRATTAMADSIASVGYSVTRLDGALEGIAYAVQNSNRMLESTTELVQTTMQRITEEMTKATGAAVGQQEAIANLDLATQNIDQQNQQILSGVNSIAKQVVNVERQAGDIEQQVLKLNHQATAIQESMLEVAAAAGRNERGNSSTVRVGEVEG